MPSPDCLFEDCRENGKAFKLFNRHKKNGILAVFNIDKEENTVTAKISAKDMLIDEDEEYCVYDWFEQKAFKLDGSGSFNIELQNYDQFKLFLFVPITDGKAIIGLKEKYMSVATFETLPNGDIKPLDRGEMLIYNSNELEAKQQRAPDLFS